MEKDWRAKFASALDCAVTDWFKRQCAEPSTRMYLYYKPQHNAYWIGAEPLNDDWILATGETVNGFKTAPQIYTWAYDILSKLPTLSPE